MDFEDSRLQGGLHLHQEGHISVRGHQAGVPGGGTLGSGALRRLLPGRDTRCERIAGQSREDLELERRDKNPAKDRIEGKQLCAKAFRGGSLPGRKREFQMQRFVLNVFRGTDQA